MTSSSRFDFAILGTGYSSLLTAVLLRRLGFDCIVLHKQSVSQIVIEESSSPIGDLLLARFCRERQCESILPLCSYETWLQSYPEYQRGKNEGSRFFRHHSNEPFEPNTSNSLTFRLNPPEQPASTLWFRPDVERFLTTQLEAEEVSLICSDQLEMKRTDGLWHIQLDDAKGSSLTAKFVIDGTDEVRLLARRLRLNDASERFTNRTRAIYGHFLDLPPFELSLSAGSDADLEAGNDPISIGTQYHLLPDGFLWQRRFDHGVTSVGIVLDAERSPLRPSKSASDEWQELISKYPSLADQFAGARPVNYRIPPADKPANPEGSFDHGDPADGNKPALQRTGRLQRLTARMVGDGWALLPTTAGYVGPWTGLAITQSIAGILRLVRAFAAHPGGTALKDALAEYETTVQAELVSLDQWSRLCFQGRGDAELFEKLCTPFFRLIDNQRKLLEADSDSPQLDHGLLDARSPVVSEALDKLSHKFKTLGPISKLSAARKAEYLELIERTLGPVTATR